jgi:hypothetical protein
LTVRAAQLEDIFTGVERKLAKTAVKSGDSISQMSNAEYTG